jgi:hypothetical protein
MWVTDIPVHCTAAARTASNPMKSVCGRPARKHATDRRLRCARLQPDEITLFTSWMRPGGNSIRHASLFGLHCRHSGILSQ